MALRKNEGAVQRGGFEDDGQVTATQEQSTPSVEQKARADVAATTAVATVAVKSQLPALGGKFVDVFKSLENALPPMDFGTLPRAVGAQGAIEAKLNGGKTVDLGRAIELTLISYRSQWVISPGDDSDEAKGHVKYSNDGETIDGTGQPIAEYIEQLKTVEGYDKAASKRYVYLTGMLDSCASGDESLITNVIEVSLSPQAVRDFDGFRFQRSAAIAAGRASAEGAERIRVTADKRSGNGKNWTTLVVSPVAK